MPHWIRNGNAWQAIALANTYIRDANAWKQSDKGWVRDANAWKVFFDLALGVPTSFSITGVTATGMTLNWTDGSTQETGWEVFLGGSFDHTKTSTTTAAVGDPYTDAQSGLSEDTTYAWKIRATDGSFQGSFTTELSQKTLLATPTGLNVTLEADEEVRLAWTRNSAANTNVEIWRCTGGSCSNFALIDTVGNVTTYIDTSVTNGTTYRYRVRNTKTGNQSNFSNIVSATPDASSAPVLNSVTWDTSPAPNCEVDVAWSDNASDETGYEVWRANGTANPFSSGSNVSGSLGANTTTYSDTTAAASTQYTYGVRKKGGGAGDEDSNTITITTGFCPT